MAVHNLKQISETSAGCEDVTDAPMTSAAAVLSCDGADFTLEVDGETKTARRAASCLLLPKRGDKVLCFFDESQNYILSILETDAVENTHIKLDGSLTLESADDISFVSNNLNMVTRTSTNLYNESFNVVSNAAAFSFDTAMFTSKKSVSNIDDNQIFSNTIETIADTSTQRFKNSFRFVECMDHLKAGNLMHTVKNLFSTRSRQAIVQADQDVKIDGERIHMG